MSSDPKPASALPAGNEADARLRSRRQSLRQIGRFAAMTAPAMLVLLEGSIAHAADDKGETEKETGTDGGWGKGDYNEHTHRHSHG